MPDYLFTTKNMTVGYDGIPIIKDIEIGLERGEILTLIGPNGAGKTTILKSIIGQLELIAGTVMVEDLNINKLCDNERAKKISVVLTGQIKPELMTCRNVVSMGRYPYTGRLGILSEKDYEIIDEAMRLVNVEGYAGKDFLELSDGQKQRVMLARAIAQEPEILVLDEPTSYLDIKYKLEFLSVIESLVNRKNLTVIMSLHEIDMAQRISDKVLCVKGEYIDRFGTADEIFDIDYISGFYEVSKEELTALGSWRFC